MTVCTIFSDVLFFFFFFSNTRSKLALELFLCVETSGGKGEVGVAHVGALDLLCTDPLLTVDWRWLS